MKYKINAQFIKDEIEESGYSYRELNEAIGTKVNRLKYVLNYGGYVTEDELQNIADFLQCDINQILDEEYKIRCNTPLEIDLMVRKLYEGRKVDIQPVYEAIIRNFQMSGKLEKFIGEANCLLNVLFPEDEITANLLPALTLIADKFMDDRIFSGSHAELDERKISDIYDLIKNSLKQNSAQQALVLFVYVLIIFDVIFLDESIASITQFETERIRDKADQYCSLTLKIENLRNALIDFCILEDLKMDDNMSIKVKNKLLHGVHLMLLACHKVGVHLNGDNLSSEYVNRPNLNAIITQLYRIITDLGFKIPTPILGMSGTRFLKHLWFLQTVFQSKKSKKFKLSFLDMFAIGYLKGKSNIS